MEQFTARAEQVQAPHDPVTAYAENQAAIRFFWSHGFRSLETILRRESHDGP